MQDYTTADSLSSSPQSNERRVTLRVVRDEDAPPYDGQASPHGAAQIINEAPRFAQLWDSVLFDHELKDSAKVVYAVLQRYALYFGSSDGKPFYASQERIAGDANCSRETVRQALISLEKQGHITRTSGGFSKPDRLVLHPPVAKNLGIPSCQESRHQLPEILASFAKNLGTSTDTSNKTLETDTLSSPSEPEPEEKPTPKKRRGRLYPERFEQFWHLYPATNGSKVDAFNAWKQLEADDQDVAYDALPSWIDSEHWGNGYVVYAERYLKKRLFDQQPVARKVRNEGDQAMAAWLQVVRHKQTGNGFPVNPQTQRIVIPARILDAADAVGGVDAIDPGNNYQRKDFLAAYRAAEVAS
jgi:hypothetical protein